MSAKKDNYLKTLSEIFDAPEASSQEKVLGLMDETMEFIREIKEKLESGDPEAQKAAFEETMQMKKVLESKMQALAEKSGLDLNQLVSFAQNPNNLSAEQKNALETAAAKLQDMKGKEQPMINLINKKI